MRSLDSRDLLLPILLSGRICDCWVYSWKETSDAVVEATSSRLQVTYDDKVTQTILSELECVISTVRKHRNEEILEWQLVKMDPVHRCLFP